MALDEQTEFMDAGILLVHLQQGKTLAQLRCRGLGATTETLKNGVVVLHSASIILLTIRNFAEIEFGRACEIVEWVVAQHILKLAAGYAVPGGVVIADAGLIGFLERRSL